MDARAHDPGGVPVALLHAWLVLPEGIHAFAFDQPGHGDAATVARCSLVTRKQSERGEYPGGWAVL